MPDEAPRYEVEEVGYVRKLGAALNSGVEQGKTLHSIHQTVEWFWIVWDLRADGGVRDA